MQGKTPLVGSGDEICIACHLERPRGLFFFFDREEITALGKHHSYAVLVSASSGPRFYDSVNGECYQVMLLFLNVVENTVTFGWKNWCNGTTPFRLWRCPTLASEDFRLDLYKVFFFFFFFFWRHLKGNRVWKIEKSMILWITLLPKWRNKHKFYSSHTQTFFSQITIMCLSTRLATKWSLD